MDNAGGADAPMPGLRVEGRDRHRSVPVGRSAGHLLQHDPAAAQRLRRHRVLGPVGPAPIRPDRACDQRPVRRARGLVRGRCVDDVGVHTQVGRRRHDARFAVRRAVHRGDLAARSCDYAVRRACQKRSSRGSTPAPSPQRPQRLCHASALHHGGRWPGLQQGNRFGPRLVQDGDARRPFAKLRDYRRQALSFVLRMARCRAGSVSRSSCADRGSGGAQRDPLPLQRVWLAPLLHRRGAQGDVRHSRPLRREGDQGSCIRWLRKATCCRLTRWLPFATRRGRTSRSSRQDRLLNPSQRADAERASSYRPAGITHRHWWVMPVRNT